MAFAIGARPDFPFVFAANRDEFYERPTEPAHWWNAGPTKIWAGRDLEAGGTWLAIAEDGRFAALTNFRNPLAPKGTLSRGSLVSEYFTKTLAPSAYLEQIDATVARYAPFNLLVGHVSKLEFWFYSSVTRESQRLGPGLYGLSNATLDTPWPKVARLKSAMNRILTTPGSLSAFELERRIFDLLRDSTRAPDEDLPKTGVSQEWERALSSIFIETKDYGTRSSAVILLDSSGAIRQTERLPST
jgi:uncharacterized protein with NRDE domain